MKTNQLILTSILTGCMLIATVTTASSAQTEPHQTDTHQMMHNGSSSKPHTDQGTCPEMSKSISHQADCAAGKGEHGSSSMHQMHEMHKNQDTHGSYSQHHASKNGANRPSLPGQDAFGAIQEIITILQADPATDWSKVNISKLRAHLVDMNRLVMDTDVHEKNIDGGLAMTITGQDRTLQAIQAMVPAHAPMIDGQNEWVAKAELTPTGATLIVTSANAKEVTHIRALGFYGLMATGGHHQTHHLGLARGEDPHAH